jgi:hypothetical protein
LGRLPYAGCRDNSELILVRWFAPIAAPFRPDEEPQPGTDPSLTQFRNRPRAVSTQPAEDFSANPLCEQARLLSAAPRQQREELIFAGTAEQIVAAEELSQTPRDLTKQVIAGIVAEP